jgi:protein-L-isoaspartate O-methyltransferase
MGAQMSPAQLHTDWPALWQALVEVSRWPQPTESGEGGEGDPWKDRAQQFARRVRRKWSRPDPLRDFVGARVSPDMTVIDIGAGTGGWAAYLAPRVRMVTAIEPSPAMRQVLVQTLADAGAANVEVRDGSWPEIAVEPHDVVLCSHSAYASPDLPAFVQRMSERARRACYLLLRLPTVDGVMAEAARRVWGHPHDSPNFVVGYNVLLQMGLLPNVLIDPQPWPAWTSPSLDAALAEIRRRLALAHDTTHDAFLRDLLARRLTSQDDLLVWPPGVRTAMAYWDTGP